MFDGHDGPGDHGGGVAGIALDIAGHGHGHGVGHHDFGHHGGHHGGHQGVDFCHSGEGLDSMGGDFGGLDTISINDALMLSFDHCRLREEDLCLTGGFGVVDGVVGNQFNLFSQKRVTGGKVVPPALKPPEPSVKPAVLPTGTQSQASTQPQIGHKKPVVVQVDLPSRHAKPAPQATPAQPSTIRTATNGRQLTPGQLAYVKRLADDPRRQFFGVHVVNHGPIDLDTKFKKMATDLGLIRIDTVTPNKFGADDTQNQLADWDNWTPPYARKRLPTGYYPHATGVTRVWKQIWQLQPKRWFWQPKPKPGTRFFNRFDRTVVEVMVVQWYYREAGDFETRLHVNVVAHPLLDRKTMQWGYLKEPFARHQAVARQLAEMLLGCLKQAKPNPIAVSLRSKIEARKQMARRRPSDNTAVEAHKQAGNTPVDKVVDEACTPKVVISSGADLESALRKPKPVKVVVRLPVRKSTTTTQDDDGL